MQVALNWAQVVIVLGPVFEPTGSFAADQVRQGAFAQFRGAESRAVLSDERTNLGSPTPGHAVTLVTRAALDSWVAADEPAE
ncbi:MAG: hypothetical protein U0163_01735 [Gemmatimonadaceae bacterium]